VASETIRTFFTCFQNPKNMTLRFFELMHTFSRTLLWSLQSLFFSTFHDSLSTGSQWPFV